MSNKYVSYSISLPSQWNKSHIYQSVVELKPVRMSSGRKWLMWLYTSCPQLGKCMSEVWREHVWMWCRTQNHTECCRAFRGNETSSAATLVFGPPTLVYVHDTTPAWLVLVPDSYSSRTSPFLLDVSADGTATAAWNCSDVVLYATYNNGGDGGGPCSSVWWFLSPRDGAAAAPVH